MNAIKQMCALLHAKGLFLVTAESLTGGLIGSTITSVSGASRVYWGGLITYTNESKARLLSIPMTEIERCGPVSRETAEAMACGALSVSDADISIAVTGLAGPLGGCPAIPVGTVWIALACKTGTTIKTQCVIRNTFRGSRTRIRKATVRAATAMVMHYLDRL